MVNEPEARARMYDTRFYEQALPRLAALGEHQRLAQACLSGLENRVSIETCAKYLEDLHRRGIIQGKGGGARAATG